MTDKKSNSRPSIQKAVVFDQNDVQIEKNGSDTETPVKRESILPATLISADSALASIAEIEDAIDASSKQQKTAKSGKKWVWFAVFVLILSSVELAIWIQQIVQTSDWLGGAWLVVLTLALVFAVKACIAELSSLRQLKKSEQFRAHSTELLSAHTIGQGKTFCEQLTPQLSLLYPSQVQQWQQSVQPHHVDKEVLQLFETKVLSSADQQALQIVTKHASASAAMIAVSPFALLDMFIVLWRNLVMLKQVSQCYGLPLSYWGRIRLIKQVFKTMLLAGATEIVSDAGNYALSAGVTGKLSTRIAQGLGVGVMTTRIGIIAMQTCRPMPWSALPKPGVSQLTQQLLSDLKALTK